MKNTLLAPELRELLNNNDERGLRSFCESLHPATVAEYLNALEPEETWQVLSVLDWPKRIEIFDELDVDQQSALADVLSPEDMAHLLEEIPPDDRADVVQQLDDETLDEILPLIPKAERAEINKLASYPEGTAGAVMTTEVATLPADCTVKDAIDLIREQAPNRETINNIYVVNPRGQLLGEVSLKDLILSPADKLIRDVMNREIIYARVDEDQEEVAKKFAKYDLIAMPIVNGGNVLVGVVTVDDIMDVIQEEVDEDIYSLGAAGEPSDYLRTSILQIARQRITWLMLLVFVGFITGMVMEHYQTVLQSVVALAFFMPLLSGSSGNAGCQTTTVIVRGLATGEISPSDAWKVIRKELAVGVLVGTCLAILAGLRAVVLNHNVKLALTVGIAMVITITAAKTIGSVLPLILRRINLDPAVMSAPLITTMLDVLSAALYLQLARMIFNI